MSLFGKILAFLNILGVAGVFALGLMTYTKKQQWQTAVALQEMYLKGLPVNAQETDEKGNNLLDNLSESNVKTLLAGGPIVKTQVDEVTRVHSSMKQATEQGEVPAQILAKARALVPFATDAGRYYELVLLQHWLAADKDRVQLKADLASAAAAVVDMNDRPAGRLPKEAFREFVTIKGGWPRTPFVLAYINAMGEQPNPDFEKTYTAALDSINANLTAELEAVFQAALTGDVGDGKPGSPSIKSSSATQRYLIVRYLYNAAPTIATPQEMTTAAGDWAPLPIKRVIAVVGLEAFPNVLIEQAARIGYIEQQLRVESTVPNAIVSELVRHIERERAEFTAQHSKLIDYLRAQAAIVADRTERLKSAKKAADEQDKLVASSKAINEKLQKSMDDLRVEIQDYLAGVRDSTKRLHGIQMKTRDAAESLQRLESEIRRRERLAP
jgi:hypothetical protein